VIELESIQPTFRTPILSLDAASMADMEVKKRYTVSLALIERQLARVTDDLYDIGSIIDKATY